MPTREWFAAKHPDIPPSVMLKVDLLRRGVRVALAPVGTRHYHHHDEKGQKTADPSAHIQGSMILPTGEAVFIAHNPQSPYFIEVNPHSGSLTLWEDGQEAPLCEVKPGPRFRWTLNRTTRQTPMASVFTPSLGGVCGPLAVFLLRYCQFASRDEECRFCSWVHMGKSHEIRPDVADLRESLGAIWEEQKSIGYLAFSGGSLYDRTKEADAFLRYMDATTDTGLPLPTSVAAIQALDKADSIRLRQGGFDYACYSMEVWEERAWREILPGKTRSLGRARWMQCLSDAVEVFGQGRVLCNFVAGVETAVPGLYESPKAAADATLEGMRWCCEHGIYPKYAIWIVSGGAQFSNRECAPLDYYARLITGRQQLYSEFPMAIPATDCPNCLTQSCEADLSRLDPTRYGLGPATAEAWQSRHAIAAVGSSDGGRPGSAGN